MADEFSFDTFLSGVGDTVQTVSNVAMEWLKGQAQFEQWRAQNALTLAQTKAATYEIAAKTKNSQAYAYQPPAGIGGMSWQTVALLAVGGLIVWKLVK